VTLLGIDSVNAPLDLRQKVWRRLGADLKPRHLKEMATTIDFDQLPTVFDKLLKAQMRGRTVVRIGA
jgi:alcohol dehydrogenase